MIRVNVKPPPRLCFRGLVVCGTSDPRTNANPLFFVLFPVVSSIARFATTMTIHEVIRISRNSLLLVYGPWILFEFRCAINIALITERSNEGAENENKLACDYNAVFLRSSQRSTTAPTQTDTQNRRLGLLRCCNSAGDARQIG